MLVTAEMKQDLTWWSQSLHIQRRVIDRGNPDLVITSDASNQGWSALCDSQQTGGRWKKEEIGQHINCLELLAICHSVRAFCSNKSNVHVKIMSDNTSAIAYINKMGGCKSPELNKLAVELWKWCISQNIWLSAAHVPGLENISDYGSRHFNDNIEWKLDKSIFSKITEIWGKPSIDLFASRINFQIEKYVAWMPDGQAEFIDAFSQDWSNIFAYIFPPFSLIGRVIAKVRKDQASCIMIVPQWPSQIWWTALMKLLIDNPVVIEVNQGTLTIPNTTKQHPLTNKLKLLACRLSGNPYAPERFQKRLPISSWQPGEIQQNLSTLYTSRSGSFSVIKNKLIQFTPL